MKQDSITLTTRVGHRTIQTPTLVITGAGDRLVSSHDSEVIATRIPNAKLVKVDGGSHAFFIEMKGRLNKEVLAFMTDG